jgi:hypothetical protein
MILGPTFFDEEYYRNMWLEIKLSKVLLDGKCLLHFFSKLTSYFKDGFASFEFHMKMSKDICHVSTQDLHVYYSSSRSFKLKTD